MTGVHQLSRTEARRIAVRAQLLSDERPASVLEAVRHLTTVQDDRTQAVAPSADLVLWSRLGAAYDPSERSTLLDEQRLVDLQGMIRPAEDIALYRAEMAAWPGVGELDEWSAWRREWLDDNAFCRDDILERLRADGPLPMSQLPDTCVRPWRSSGWNNNRNVARMLDMLVERGEVAVTGRAGRERLFDLASRVYADDPPVPLAEALRIRDERRLRSLGVARSRGTTAPVEPVAVGEAGEAAVIDGVRGHWRVDPAYLGSRFRGRTALVSPLDRLVFDRKRLTELFEFDYQLEMYKPAAKRRWGYFALPILHGDQFVGKVDATSDHNGEVLRVNAIHEDTTFTTTLTAAVGRELRDLAEWLELELLMPR